MVGEAGEVDDRLPGRKISRKRAISFSWSELNWSASAGSAPSAIRASSHDH